MNKYTNISLFLVKKKYEKIKIRYLSAFHSNFADKIRDIVTLIRHNAKLKARVKRASTRLVVSAENSLRLQTTFAI